MVFWSCILSLFLWLRVSQANADGWSAVVSESVVGLSGSCVVIPCTFSYPANGKTYTEFTGIWFKVNDESTVYDNDTSKIIASFKGRTSLIGDLTKNNCSLKISSLSSSDTGPFMFRIEIKDLDKYTYVKNTVSITVKETQETPSVPVEEEVTSGKRINTLYPPFNVKVITKPSVKENDSVELSCSSNSNPPANSYQWFSSNGKMLAKSHTYKLERVSRHTEAISCTAINTEGKNSSAPRKINTLYKYE